MDKISWMAFLFQSLPESILLIWAGLALVGVKPKFNLLLLVGFLHTLIVVGVRMLPIKFGMHMPIAIITWVILLCMCMKLKIRVAVVATLLGTVLLYLFEGVCIPLVLNVMDLSMKEVLASTKLRILAALPQEALLALVVFLCRRFKAALVDSAKGMLDN